MSDQIKILIEKLELEIYEWPLEHKSSFVDGLTEGLHIALLMANDAGCNLAKDERFLGFCNHLETIKYPPLKRRGKIATKTPREQLFDDVRELVRRAIACRLKISKQKYDTLLEAWGAADAVLLIAMAIARHSALDDSIRDIQTFRTLSGYGETDREIIRVEVENCYEIHKVEIATIERLLELSARKNFNFSDIWIYLRSVTPLSSVYEDDDLQEIDVRYKAAF